MIVLLNIVTMIFLAILFSRHAFIRNREQKNYKKCEKRFREAFKTILESPYHWSIKNIEDECECSVEEFKKFRGNTYSQLICNIRLEMNERLYLPNAQLLCELTGVRSYIENNLLHGRKVTQNLQLIMTLPLRISEGRLALYTNYRDKRIKQIARLCLVLCTESDPFRYLIEDLDGPIATWRLMSLHRLHGWLAATNRQEPPFLTIASRVKNEHSAAFMIEEVAYWGTEQEKKALSRFILTERAQCRKAAIHAIAMIDDRTQEEAVIDSYVAQPEEVQKEILKTVTSLNTGRHAAFLEKCFITAPSKQLAELALLCLRKYGKTGYQRFQLLRQTPIDRRSRHLLEQIESMSELEEKREHFVPSMHMVHEEPQEESPVETTIIPEISTITPVANETAEVEDDIFNLDGLLDADGNFNMDSSDESADKDTNFDFDIDDLYKE